MPFNKGSSGNPGGRPKSSAWLKSLAGRHTEAAIRTLVECLGDKDGRVRVAASNALLDRAHGKPSQEVTATVINTNPDELHERIITALAEVGSIDDAGSTGEPH